MIVDYISDHLPVFCINSSDILNIAKAKEVFVRKHDDESINDAADATNGEAFGVAGEITGKFVTDRTLS